MPIAPLVDMVTATNHGDLAISHLTSQFIGKPNIEALMQAIGSEIDEVEDALVAMFDFTSIDTATDSQLDVIGVLVDLLRRGMNDAEYRTALYSKINLNIANGTPNEVISLTKLVTGATSLKYQELYPARVRITLYGDFPSATSITGLRQLVPVAVGPLELLSWGLETPVFSFSTLDGPQDDPNSYAEGFGTTDDPTLGGIMASIYEVTV